jgi:hypothetical protein
MGTINVFECDCCLHRYIQSDTRAANNGGEWIWRPQTSGNGAAPFVSGVPQLQEQMMKMCFYCSLDIGSFINGLKNAKRSTPPEDHTRDPLRGGRNHG